jgi:hypothetical protein
MAYFNHVSLRQTIAPLALACTLLVPAVAMAAPRAST